MTTTATATGSGTGPRSSVRHVLRDPLSLLLAAAQPVVFVVLFRNAPGAVVWSGTPLVVLASTYLRLRLAGPHPTPRGSP